MPLRFDEVVDRPLLPAPFRWRIGVRALAATHWLQPDDARDADLAEKAALLATRPDDVVGWLPGSESAATELESLVRADLDRRALTLVPGGVHPIDRAARSVQEDLCLMERRDHGWILTAGSVCFPTRWSLRDKLGGSLASIHEPVPGYAEELGEPVARFFDRMSPGTLAWRVNWSLVGDPARRLEVGDRQAPGTPPADPGSELFMRVERQTLRRLAGHEAIVFGIRVHSWPLDEVIGTIAVARLGDGLGSMPPEIAAYKDLENIRPTVLAWLTGDHG